MNPTRYTKLHHRSVHPSIRLDFPGLPFTSPVSFLTSHASDLLHRDRQLLLVRLDFPGLAKRRVAHGKHLQVFTLNG
ncbi:hypothetical protein L2E82_35375 [Cichorium intybus]|uniref:Uncharacterized protein n=1 Tax=Cichorium intybus TaxID=13427 RepID=A0ACB9BNS0_CICIN|nr:hypothetical protein L2E82_35375 [Cichorium intybus]